MPQFEYHNNTCGIANFKAKPNDGYISDLEKVGMIESIDYLTEGRYRVNLVAPLNTAELYQPIFTAPAGFLTGIDFQNESYFDIGLQDRDGNWTDCAGKMTVSFNRLTEAVE